MLPQICQLFSPLLLLHIASCQPTAIAMTSQCSSALTSSTSSAYTTDADPEPGPEPGTNSQ